jgi:hypothetical protein
VDREDSEREDRRTRDREEDQENSEREDRRTGDRGEDQENSEREERRSGDRGDPLVSSGASRGWVPPRSTGGTTGENPTIHGFYGHYTSHSVSITSG